MCRLISILGSECAHPLKIDWALCPQAPRPQRCPTMIGSIDGSSLDPETPFCPKCAGQRRANMIADFHEERRQMTKIARAGKWSDEDISVMRMELRDELYEQLKYVNRPPPFLPGESSASRRG